MIWGGKGAYGTFFSGEPEHLYGINWLPFHGGSLYLGRFPDFAERSYDALLQARGGPHWKTWADLVVMYRALSDPADAARQWSALAPTVVPEAGNSRANVALWTLDSRPRGPRGPERRCGLAALRRLPARRRAHLRGLQRARERRDRALLRRRAARGRARRLRCAAPDCGSLSVRDAVGDPALCGQGLWCDSDGLPGRRPRMGKTPASPEASREAPVVHEPAPRRLRGRRLPSPA